MARTKTQILADFVTDTTIENLPEQVVDYTKLVILDSLICGLAAGGLERSRMMHRVVARGGGAEESSVFGLDSRVPADLAVMANAEIMNLLDADDTFFNSSHFAVFSVAAGLAEAQRLGASGRDLVCAVAVGFDINARLDLSKLTLELVDGQFRWSPIQGMGHAAFGTAASAASIARLTREQTRHAFGLAGWMAPTPAAARMNVRTEFGSMKYANYAGAAHAGMLAVRFAEQGYIGEQDVLDSDPGFIRAQGAIGADQELMIEDLGEKWWILETALKYYPSCRYTHGPIDALLELMRREHLAARDLERIEVRLNPMAYSMPFFRTPADRIEPDHRAPLHGAFNVPYVMALAALGRTPGPSWYSAKNLEDPEVRSIASRVHTAPDELAAKEALRAFTETRIRRFRKTRGALSVRAHGREFVHESDYCGGDPWTPQTRATWERIGRKFHDFCGDMMPPAAIDRIVEQVRSLESVDDVSAGLDLTGR